MLKKILIGLALLAIIGYGAYYYMSYYYGVKDYTTSSADFKINSAALKGEFVSNETAATKKYQDKAIEVSGVVTSAAGDTVSFDGVDFKFAAPVANIKAGDKLSIKGRLVGYDSLVESVQLDQCTIVK